jgi:phospholipase D1/2
MVEGEVRDPVSKSFWKALLERSKRNTGIYREIFACDPDDTMRTVAELRKLREGVKKRAPREQLDTYKRLKEEIKGYVVEWPTHFMEDENLTMSWTQVESLLPQETYL